MPSSPVRVGVVFGGASGEHDISIRSAITVILCRHLPLPGAGATGIDLSRLKIDFKRREIHPVARRG